MMLLAYRMLHPTVQRTISFCCMINLSYSEMHINEVLDRHSLPINSKEVEQQSHGVKFNFIESLHPDNIKLEVINALNCANSFWNIPDINTHLYNFVLNDWLYDKNINNR